MLECASLLIETPYSRETVWLLQPRPIDGVPERLDRSVVYIERNRERMAVLAAVGYRITRWITEARRSPVDHLGDERERRDGACADTGREQQIREVSGSGLAGGGQRTAQPSKHDVREADIVMRRHRQMRLRRESELGLRTIA